MPDCVCAGCGTPTRVITITPVSVTATSFLRLLTVTTSQTKAAKKTAQAITCIPFLLLTELRLLTSPDSLLWFRLLAPRRRQRSGRRKSLLEGARHLPILVGTSWPSPDNSPATANPHVSSG